MKVKRVHHTKRPELLARFAMGFCVMGIFLMTMPFADAQTQTSVQATNQTSVATKKSRLHIAKDIQPEEYREQFLSFTPLGSSYEQVASFSHDELKAEQPNITDYTLQADTRLFNKPGYPTPLPRGKPVGAAHLIVNYHAQPSWWRRELIVNVFYVFDSKHKLMEVYCHAGPLSSS